MWGLGREIKVAAPVPDELGSLGVEGKAIIRVVTVVEEAHQSRCEAHTDDLQQGQVRNKHLLTHIAFAVDALRP